MFPKKSPIFPNRILTVPQEHPLPLNQTAPPQEPYNHLDQTGHQESVFVRSFTRFVADVFFFGLFCSYKDSHPKTSFTIKSRLKDPICWDRLLHPPPQKLKRQPLENHVPQTSRPPSSSKTLPSKTHNPEKQTNWNKKVNCVLGFLLRTYT